VRLAQQPDAGDAAADDASGCELLGRPAHRLQAGGGHGLQAAGAQRASVGQFGAVCAAGAKVGGEVQAMHRRA